MELLLRVHHHRSPTRDLWVDVDANHTVADLAGALAQALGVADGTAPDLTVDRVGRRLDPDTSVGEAQLLSGDDVVLGPTQPLAPAPPTPIRAVSVDVLAGPDSGHSAVLDRGRYVLGRDRDCDLSVSDVTVSRRHVEIEVALDWTVTVTPLPDTENGVLVNGERVEEPTVVGGDDVVTLGATRVAFREFIRAADEAVDRLGQIEFHRTPHRPVVVRPQELDPLGPIPTRPDNRRFQIFSIVAPLAAGLILYAFTRQLHFLAIILISPLAMIGNWFEDRRSGKRRYRDQLATFRDRLAEHRARADAALDEERVARLRSAPDLADLARRAELRTIDLWPRDRRSDDFATVRIGLGDTTSLVSAPLATGGDDDLREEAHEALRGVDQMRSVPVTVSLKDAGVLAVHGDPERVDDVAASVLVQLACLHSPEDLILAGAVDPIRTFADWLKWLPHTRSVTSPLARRHLHTTADGARALISELIQVAELRVAETDHRVDRRWPWVVAVIDGDQEPDATSVSQLLDLCPAAGISVIWLCSAESRVPRQASAIVDCQVADAQGRSVLWHTDPDLPVQHVELGRVHPEVADRVARSLAPVRDASVATATTAIPRTVPLLSVLGTSSPDEEWVAARWRTERGYSLRHPVGLGPDGVVELDLVADGPHALIGGTSGAGKSELLQSMVGALIATYPSSRLNLLFVDYKGGASSTVFRDVPHTVGYVTNLDATLSRRALTSLRAELDRRMRLLEGRAKDLEEMLVLHPDEAPPSLVIVVDEFATLVKEVPEFVAGVVDIAQRGRSLGIHLILATQRPSGSINDNILANTNLRISLRMLDPSESNAVIGAPDAAQIPVPLRGRAFARLGPSSLIPFQSAYASAPLGGGDDERAIVVRRFEIDDDSTMAVAVGDRTAAAETEERTQLDGIIDAVVAAHRRSGLDRPRPPWREMLADHLTLDELRTDPRARVDVAEAGRRIALGIVDHPERQDQYPALVDLEESGGLLVVGTGGSGKTTLLRTIAAGAAADAGPDRLVVFGIDAASRALRSIVALPHVATVATGDDLEAVTRVIALLDAELDRRRRILGEEQSETLSAHLARGGDLPRVLLLVDGLENLVATLTGGGLGSAMDAWLTTLQRVILDGRQVGIHSVLTTSRRAGVPAVLVSSIGERLVLRQADPAAYADLGLPTSEAKDLDLPAGRGLWQGNRLLQVASVSADAEGQAQAAELVRRAEALAGARPAIRTRPLPESVDAAELPAVDGLAVPIGLADLTLAPVAVDLTHSHMVISGIARSGRSTAATVMAEGLRAAGLEVWAVGPATSPLAGHIDRATSGFGRPAAISPVLEELAQALERPAGERPRALVVDDLDALDDMSLNPLWERIAASDDIRVVATIEVRSLTGFTSNPLLTQVRSARRSLVLQPEDALEFFQATGVRSPVRPGTPMPAGRGILLVDRRPTVVQVAHPSG